MRLRDADALIDYFGGLAGDTIAITDVQAIIDNAPTVSCGECVYGEGVGTWGMSTHCTECYGAVRFKAKP